MYCNIQYKSNLRWSVTVGTTPEPYGEEMNAGVEKRAHGEIPTSLHPVSIMSESFTSCQFLHWFDNRCMAQQDDPARKMGAGEWNL